MFAQEMTAPPKALAIQCDLCGDTVEAAQIAPVGDKNCCRPCSASIRSDISLVDAFVDWHKQSKSDSLIFTRIPVRTEFRPGLFGAVAEFEAPDILGTISMRADGQCDTDVIRASSERHVLCTYAILITREEVRDHLFSTYETIKSEQADAGNRLPPVPDP